MPFAHFPVVVYPNPAMGNPVRTGMWRVIPTAGNPHVVITIPAVITGNPYNAGFRGRSGTLDNHGRRRYSNDDLCDGGHRRQCKSKQYCKCKFLHGESIPPVFVGLRNPCSVPLL
jgi:hypothetical protein